MSHHLDRLKVLLSSLAIWLYLHFLAIVPIAVGLGMLRSRAGCHLTGYNFRSRR
jgi:hypothetical protein